MIAFKSIQFSARLHQDAPFVALPMKKRFTQSRPLEQTHFMELRVSVGSEKLTYRDGSARG
jgi:hypothetical protein